MPHLRHGHMPEIVALDREGLPLSCAAKPCSGTGLSTLQRWLGEGKAEVLLLHNGSGRPVVLVSWDAWNRVARTVVKGDSPAAEPRQPGHDHSPLARAL